MTELIIPSKIPWDQIQGKDLEELLYWLLDEMGAKDLEWRIGGYKRVPPIRSRLGSLLLYAKPGRRNNSSEMVD
jgi:hypothetical protein